MLCVLTMNAQPSFVRYYQNAGSINTSVILEMESGNLMSGFAYNSGTSLIDPLGNILHVRRYLVDTFMMLQSIRKHTDNDFAFVGIYSKDTCGSPVSANPAIGRMDSLGNITYAKYFTFNDRCAAGFGGDLEITVSNDIVAWGRDYGFYAIRTDPNCELRWAKRFPNRGGFRFIKELSNGDLLTGINMETAGAAVGRMDAEGNFIWLKSYFRSRAMITDALIEEDGGFVIAGFTDSIASPGFLDPLPTNYWPKLFMMKLDGDGEVLWCKGYDISPYRWYPRWGSRLDRTLDGNYVMLATIGFLSYPGGYRPMMMKTDQNGDTLWTRAAGRSNNVQTAYNLLVCSDGGYLQIGVDDNIGGYYLFKHDSLGYLPCYNRWHTTTILDLFPTDSSFTLTSIDGATAHPAFITEAENPPITILEGCANSIPRPEKHPSGFRIKPNPSTGHFTLSFTDPLMAESYYSVYDTMGKLLFQRPVPQGKATEEVDLTRFGAGTYVLRFTSKEGSCYERVVVE